MSKKEGNCWGFFDCSKEDKSRCPAYTENRGQECWIVAARNTELINSGVGVTDGEKRCWDCSFFQLMLAENNNNVE